ncbi:pyridoxine 5'-phosphate synthase [Christiangramia forsetii]|uniref:Pyridoxine 5'-phosphate synthase n=2 Tax=Christiangramia forsetii TaxID=411153 RepID=PDXJ_CHRFK|nr:pyridoxine 5'-phosphate synthase [Christiangramia forsetii]A0LXW0.1 RecName: Full=Pyridoxine 5'-phosphate synthase; Short=PNP synthase [Christiangramia forsetii KT0803]GGG35712.1 pyridoxine 5'-phosphate synthase [Christiangramia forsetii]CAL65205.1 pyridoxal phosphate biosynthesis protein [Christiangramia forsetii KT0803]
MTKLSVNINKIATLRNARGGDVPNVLEAAKNIESFGAEGITVHPRPDERHIRYADARELKPVLNTEFNIEGKPIQQFIDLVLEVKPAQVTLVPDAENAITSDSGWDTVKHRDYLKEVIAEFKANGIRTSIFVDPVKKMIEGAAETGSDRIELYTESFAVDFEKGNSNAVKPYAECAKIAHELGLGINAGHDLSLKNINYFKENVPYLDEVSIGHALISEALYLGLEKTIQQYLKLLK